MGQGNTKQSHFNESFAKLSRESVKYSEKEFWDSLISDCQEENLVFELLRFTSIQELILTQPENITSLIYYTTNKIQAIVNKSEKEKLTQEDFSNLSACIRILIKIIPPIFAHSNRKLSETIFWTSGYLEPENIILHSKTLEDSAGVEIQKLSDILGSEFDDKQSNASFILEGNEGSCVAEVLISLICQLLFLPNYTIASGIFDPNSENSTLVWTKGVLSTTVQSTSTQMISNRKLVLTLLLVCLCEQLYHETEKVEANGWLEALVRSDNSRAKIIFLSLLNTSLNYDPIGWGLPYNYLLFADTQEELVDLSLQLLSVIFNYSPTSHDNIFITHLQSINQITDFTFIYNGLTNLLNNPIYAKNSYLPASTKEINCYQEQLIIFWVFITHNREFLNYILRNEDITTITTTILYYMVESRHEDHSIGFIHLIAFTLLVLSGERLFGIQMNKTFNTTQWSRNIPPFKGSFNDFLILVFHKLLVDSNPKLTSLHECLFTIITNLSPYISSLSMVSSMALLKLFKRYSHPPTLLSSDRIPRYVHFLLETFNNLIQYQFPGNHPLVYAILINKDCFFTLSSLRIKINDDLSQHQPPLNQNQVQNITDNQNNNNNNINDINNNNNNNNKNSEAKSHPNNIPSDRWVPTNEWLQEWKSQLPLSTPIRLIKSIEPELPVLLKDASDETAILNYLKTTTLVGLLPVPHPILIRKYQQNEATSVWFIRFVWGLVVVRNRNPTIFGSKAIKLFRVY